MSVWMLILLGVLGTAFFVWLAYRLSLRWWPSLAIRLALPILPAYAPPWVIAVVLGVAMLTGLLFSLLPARKAARLDPVLALQSE